MRLVGSMNLSFGPFLLERNASLMSMVVSVGLVCCLCLQSLDSGHVYEPVSGASCKARILHAVEHT